MLSTHSRAARRTDIKTVMIIGAGPIVIGQACEFDYSGTQACKALKAEGYRVILLNSNPATIMTDPETADRTYIGPMTPELVEQVRLRCAHAMVHVAECASGLALVAPPLLALSSAVYVWRSSATAA